MSAQHGQHTLKVGDKGGEVRQWQYDLLALAPYFPKYSELKLPRFGADGVFGEEVRRATLALQIAHGLDPEASERLRQARGLDKAGEAGPRTRAVAKLNRVSPPDGTTFSLVVWKAKQLPPEWWRLVTDFDSISFKTLEGAHPFRPEEVAQLVKELKDHAPSLALESWGYAICRTLDQAAQEGRIAGELCRKHGFTAHHWNAESAWAEGAKNPNETALAFADAFRAVTKGRVVLIANCWWDTMNGRPVLTQPIIDGFDFVEPMCYGTRPRTIARKWYERLGLIPPEKRAAMVGTGRRDETGNSWGWLEGPGREPGLVDLVQGMRPARLSLFRAFEEMLTTGNDVNPALPKQVQRLREELR